VRQSPASAGRIRIDLLLWSVRTWIPRPPLVLVLDDDPDILKLLGMCLESEGCVVRTASDTAEALTQVEGVDVAIVDQRMPSMSGTEFIQVARARHSTARFVVISGRDEIRREAIAAGADTFLLKPISARELVLVVEKLFAAGSVPSRAAG
jgi:two-component system response regulator GlrR